MILKLLQANWELIGLYLILNRAVVEWSIYVKMELQPESVSGVSGVLALTGSLSLAPTLKFTQFLSSILTPPNNSIINLRFLPLSSVLTFLFMNLQVASLVLWTFFNKQ